MGGAMQLGGSTLNGNSNTVNTVVFKLFTRTRRNFYFSKTIFVFNSINFQNLLYLLLLYASAQPSLILFFSHLVEKKCYFALGLVQFYEKYALNLVQFESFSVSFHPQIKYLKVIFSTQKRSGAECSVVERALNFNAVDAIA
ncbi:MAG: hypothetical protein IKO85_08325 [Bacteroidaceae bacterium]|nr:hypothetical protein [Bacteroidaceae bacterium]